MLLREELRKYQIDLVEKIKNTKKILLAVDMGLGKTISCLTAIADLFNENKIKKILIVAPLRVAHTTWPDEIKNWEHLNNLTYTVIKGNEKQRLDCLKEDKLIYIINRENIPWLLENISFNFDTIIWDESSSLKNTKLRTPLNKPTRYGAFLKISEASERIILLTGTPTVNGLKDIYGQIFVLDRGLRLGKNKTKFYNDYFTDVSRDNNYQIWVPRSSSYEIIMGKIEDLTIKMKTEDYLQLPDFLSIETKLNFDNSSLKTYNKLKSDLILADDNVVAVNKAVLINKLLQLTNGCIYNEDKEYKIYHTIKIDYLKELIEENDDENILVFYNFQFEKDLLKKYFKDIVFLKDDNDIKKWNDKKIKLFACHPASAGHGLNLQNGGNIMIWLSLPWSLELYLQANKRLHRSGQKNIVKCYHLLINSTVDEIVLNCLKNKDITQEKVFSLIKNL